MKLNMVSERRVSSSSPGIRKYCWCPLRPCTRCIVPTSEFHVLTFSSPLIRHTWGGVLMCISELPSPFHQFRLLVALASAWSLTHTTLLLLYGFHIFSSALLFVGCVLHGAEVVYFHWTTKQKSAIPMATGNKLQWKLPRVIYNLW
jgi:hypothetical protein